MRALAAEIHPSAHPSRRAFLRPNYSLLMAPALFAMLTYEGVLLEPWLESVCFQLFTFLTEALIPASFHMPSIF